MTPQVLLDCLKKELEDSLNSLVLQSKSGVMKPPSVFAGGLPPKEHELQDDDIKEQFPFVLLKAVGGKAMSETEADTKIRIVAGIYTKDGEKHGNDDILNLITKIRIALLEKRVIGGQFELIIDDSSPLEWLIYDEQTSPYYIGELMTTWTVPMTQREWRF